MGCKHAVALICVGVLFLLPLLVGAAEPGDLVTIARLKYGGGGDWYCDPTSLPNLLEFFQEQTNRPVAEKEAVVAPSDRSLFNYPYLYLTGHGKITFSDEEASLLRRHLTSGGFLQVDDCYGLDEHFRREIKKVFPDQPLQEVPYAHDIYHCFYDFPNGPPKVHEHDGKPPQGFGIFYQGEMVVYYTYESDLGDGWEDPDVHNDPEEIRLQALKMGVNVILYALRRYELASDGN
ncbi:MAG: DUF4159 domain-containing protein [bacterium]